MGQISDWWLNRTVDGDWQLPIKSVQGLRPVGGYLVGTATTLEFVPNRFEALVGATSWTTSMADIESVTLGRRRLRIVSHDAAGSHTLYTSRPKAVRARLATLLPTPS
jgi:hypothetical protein